MPTIDARIIEALKRGNIVTEYIIYPQQDINIKNYQIALLNVPSSSKEDVTVIYNKNVIPHWVQKLGTVWVNLPILFASRTIKIYTITGNPSATKRSNGTNVFDVFDDFSSAVLNSMWTKTTGTWTQSGNTLQQTSTSVINDYIYTTPVATNNYIIECLIRPDAFGTDKRLGLGCRYNGLSDTSERGHLFSILYSDATKVVTLDENIVWGTGVSIGFTFTTNIFYHFKVVALLTDNVSIKGKAWNESNIEPVGWTISTTLSTQTAKNVAIRGGEGTTSSYKDFRVRKYIINEPIIKKNKVLIAARLLKELLR